jgi:glucose/arabinose dehydrogenase
MKPHALARALLSKAGAHVIAFVIAFAASLAFSTLQAATPPSGFSDSSYVTGLSAPTAMAFAPDGRLFVAEQGGDLRVIENGTLLATPFVSITVDSTNERGLLGVAFDPNFATNQHVFVYYTSTAADRHNRVSRFTANGNVAVPGSEQIIVELDAHGASNHNGGALHFGADGKLYIATGDNANGANAQSMTSRHGKILRINADGSIPTDNPFYGSATGANRAIWALGLRNPFTFTFQPGTGRMFINDVGQNTWEEINDGIAGSNYGWPTTEGETTNPAFRSPLYAYDHGQGCAITGGAFYNPAAAQFPSEFVGDYFFADYCGDWIRRYDPATDTVTNFLTGASGPVDIQVGPDGSLFYLNINDGSVRRVQYIAGTSPAITDHPDAALRSVGQSVTFTVSASGTPPLSYQWQRNGTNIPGATSSSYTINSVQISDDGANFRAVVTNSFGNATSNSAQLTVISGSPPAASITTPASGTLYNAGDTINYSGDGTDAEDGTLPASAFTWSIVFHHDAHTHPFIAEVTGTKSGSFQIPDIGHIETNVWYRIHLTVEDSSGLNHSVTRDIHPRTVDLSFDTDPSGLQVTVDGQPQTAPHTVESVIGMRRDIGVVSPQLVAPNGYVFGSWAHGGGATQEIVTPASDTSYEARFLKAILFDDKTGQNQPLNGVYPTGVANWGTGQWLHSGPFGSFTTKSVSFANSSLASASFSFITPKRLVSLQAYNGGSGSTTVTLSCAGQPNKQQAVPAGQVATITTGWTGNCASVTIASTNGWNTNFDDVAYDSAAATYGVNWTADNTPSSMAPSATVDVNLSFTNTGSATWNASGANPVRVSYHWRQGSCPGTSTALWDGLRTDLPGDVATGGSLTGLASDLRAPTAPGTYCVVWDLVKEGVTWFSSQGAQTLTRTVSVAGAPPFDVTWTADSTPGMLPSNGLVNVRLSFANTGSSTWNATGANPVRVAYHWRQGACDGTSVVVWDGLRTNLASNVAPSGTVSNLNARLRAPSGSGTFCLIWDLVKEGVTWFSSQGADTRNKTVSVGSYDVNWTADNIPASMTAGATVNVTLSFSNAGSVTWPSGGGNPVRVSYHWKQGGCPGGVNAVWDGLRTGLAANVGPAGNVTDLSSQLKAPPTPGTYCVAWDLVHEGVGWFSSQGGDTLQQTVTVN